MFADVKALTRGFYKPSSTICLIRDPSILFRPNSSSVRPPAFRGRAPQKLARLPRTQRPETETAKIIGQRRRMKGAESER